jgi:hypothetical protein
VRRPNVAEKHRALSFIEHSVAVAVDTLINRLGCCCCCCDDSTANLYTGLHLASFYLSITDTLSIPARDRAVPPTVRQASLVVHPEREEVNGRYNTEQHP